MTSAATERDRLQRVLRETAEGLEEARLGYEAAAAQVESGHLRALFRYNAGMRATFQSELGEARTQLGGEGGDHGAAPVPAKAFWDGLREFLGGGDEVRLLDECERWEQSVIDDYEIALAEMEPPDDLARILRRQRRRIEAEVENLRELKTEFIGTRDRQAME